MLDDEDQKACKNKASLTLSAFKEMDTDEDGQVRKRPIFHHSR